MIAFRHGRSSSPPPSTSRPGLSVTTDPSVFSPPSSPLSPPGTIVAPKPVRAAPPDLSHDPRIPKQLPLTASSASSPPPPDPIAAFSDDQDGVPPPMSEVPSEIYVDDEGLSAVEKIYLFCRSKSTMHRVFISRSLHTFLPAVSPLEAVRYVLPLLNGLAVDDDEAVKEALVTNLVAIMWWFFQNCRLVEDEPPEEPEEPPEEPPLLAVQTFTPILGSLLIDHNAMVGGPARFAVVEILNRLRAAEDSGQDHAPFGTKERKMLEQEIVHQVIIGMGRLDFPEEASRHPSPDLAARPALTSPLPPPVSLSSPIEQNLPIFSSPSLPDSQLTAAPSQSISPFPTQPTVLSPFMPPVPALSPGNLSSSPASPIGPQSPPSQEEQSRVAFASASPSSSEDPFNSWIPPSPHPNSEATFGDAAVDEGCVSEDDGWLTAEGQNSQDTQEDAREQAAIGRLSSMSLIATVTANAKLPEETTTAFADEVAYIGGDPLHWVRREASFAVGALAKVVPTDIVLLTLLPLFEALAHDAVWQVRHSAVFALPGILARLTPQHRRALALETLIPLAGDETSTVRSGVLEVLGEVIYTFHNDDGGAPEELVGMFVGREDGVERRRHRDGTERWLSDPTATKAKKPPGALSSAFDSDEESPGADTGDREGQQTEAVGMFGPSPAVLTTPGGFFRDPARGLITSFNYPAVALSLGPRRWSEVRAYYLSLTRDGNPRVRRTIAAGLGEMARILGNELARRDLLDVWQEMVHDAEDGETRLKALGGVSLFVGAVEGATRENVVGAFVELWERWLTGWRERECLTQALPALVGLVDGQAEVVRTLLGKALVDSVAAVREAAIAAVSPVLRAFESRPHLAEALRDELQGLARADLCRRRATYVACYRALVESENGKDEVARDEFWDRIVYLSKDRVVDVRIGVARLLGVICAKFYPEPESRSACLSETVRRLGRDPSRDVRAFVAFLLVPTGSLRNSPTVPEPATPPVMFATFSRPPPKTPPLSAMVEGMKDLGVGEDLRTDLAAQEDRMPGSWPYRPGLEGGSHSARDSASRPVSAPSRKENEDRDQGEMATNSDPFKPLAMQRRRPDDWEPS